VHWCTSCQTALAEAEVEYKEKQSPSIYVAFPLPDEPGTSLVIWTTTPWTLPANQGIAVQPKYEYVAVKVGEQRYVVAKELAESFIAACRLRHAGTEPVDVSRWLGKNARNPLNGKPSLIMAGDHVTLEAGTGCVHTAPGHGEDDYYLGREHGLAPFAPVDDGGVFTAEAGRYAGQFVFKANPEIVSDLVAEGALLSDPGAKITHQYPHCWRCKTPVIFRATDQWFIALEHAGLRQKSLADIDRTRWVPPWGRDRIYGMVEHRPDWCISRQRAWGVPLPVLYCQDCGHAIADAKLMDHVAGVFDTHGADAWFTRELGELVPAGTRCPKCPPDKGTRLKKGEDIVDVWFESGVSWAAVCEADPQLGVPVDLYLEGSDQHRGWFHSALLTAVGVRGAAPYKDVLTHGFVLSSEGKPYSKSDIEKQKAAGGKVSYVPPDDVIAKNGAELLRLWAAGEDYKNDVTYSDEVLRNLTESYRKYRNVARFVVGNLRTTDDASGPADYSPEHHQLPPGQLLEVDRYGLLLVDRFLRKAREHYQEFHFRGVYTALVDFLTNDLSAFYLDLVKDRLYCAARGSRERRSAQTVLEAIGRALCTTFAPVLCFTAEEVWRALPRRPGDPRSVHLALLPAALPDAELGGETFASRWDHLRSLRAEVVAALEPFRREKRSPNDARVTISGPAADAHAAEGLSADELAELMGVSQVVLETAADGQPRRVRVEAIESARCERCWRRTPDVSAHDGTALCGRCDGVLGGTAGAAT
jgi:isoleucyl-tRNA synthetase